MLPRPRRNGDARPAAAAIRGAVPMIRIENTRSFPGALHGLTQPTAMAILRFAGDLPGGGGEFDRRIAALIREMFSEITTLPESLLAGRRRSATSRRHVAAQNMADIAVALQLLSGHPSSRGIVLKTADAAVFHVAIPYFHRRAGEAALVAAGEIISLALEKLNGEAAAQRAMREGIADRIRKYRSVHIASAPPAGTTQLVRIAEKRNVPWTALAGGIVQFGQGIHTRRLNGTFTDRTSNIAARVARNKMLSSSMMRMAGLPVPNQWIVGSAEGAIEAAKKIGLPVVVKPADEDGGVGVFAGLKTQKAVREAYEKAVKASKSIVVEKHIDGDDYRLLVIDGRFISAVRRIPGGVTGDGEHTIEQLIAIYNADPRRGDTKEKLVKLTLDDEALSLIRQARCKTDTVLKKGRFLALRQRANLNTGGTPESASAIIHPDNCRLAEWAARIVGLDIAGVDYLTTDISKSWRETGGAICEVNGQPVLRPHWFADPDAGVNERIFDHVMAKAGNGRIPVVAVTGTHGRSTICRMLHAILVGMKVRAGAATTRGGWIGPDRIADHDVSGCAGGAMLLLDPSVQAAIVELPHKALLNAGFPFDRCTVAGITDLGDEDVGKDGITSLEGLAAIESAVLERARGAMVVNADDEVCVNAASHFKAPKKILISAKPRNRLVEAHVADGGVAIVTRASGSNRQIGLAHLKTFEPIAVTRDIPACGNGDEEAGLFCSLFTAALAVGLNLPLAAIGDGLRTFSPDRPA